ncbi:MAG: translation initiation factor IF-2 [Planctomycetes bacterium]|nr:translation initiation factor IF-2 [Planctomycetota bacterium]
MNITELARKLRITPAELHEYLPQFGFDIGRKAIKINTNLANRIIKEWPLLKRRMEEQKTDDAKDRPAPSTPLTANKQIIIPNFITVREFSALTSQPVKIILAELMKNGVIASLNEKIDFDTAWLIGSDLGLSVIREETAGQGEASGPDNKLKNIMAQESKNDLKPRPPVIVVMGHVDHGKTKLLDAIRRTNVVDQEAGGITQHIGAYQVTRRHKLITFIDTPGHEAFTAMRSRGAKIADVAILVVAADDGVMPQTVEAFQIIKAAGIPFVVAINKIDKPEANLDKTKQELATKLQITPEDWGGQTVCAPISAKTGAGITDLLDLVLLTADTEAEHITANPAAAAVGTVVESHVDKGAGPVATILVQNGTLKIGDQLTLNGVQIGKVRCLNDYRGEKIDIAAPATPVQVIGLKSMPQVGDMVQVGAGEKIKFKKVKNFLKETTADNENGQKGTTGKKINLIIKSDVLGSAEAIEESLEKINTEEVRAQIVRKGLGNITDGDIKQAEAAGAAIIGFNVKVPAVISELAREKNVIIKIYSIIYDLLNDVKEMMQNALEPFYSRRDLGRLKVLAVFKTVKGGQIIGGKVIDGIVEARANLEIEREKNIIGRGLIAKLQSAKQDVSFCEANQECGIEYEGNQPIAKDDILIIYREEKVVKKL